MSFCNDLSCKYTTISVLESSAFASVAMADPNTTLGFLMYPTGIVHRRHGSDVEPKLAKASALGVQVSRDQLDGAFVKMSFKYLHDR